ncbi:MAG TPA: DUF481 domain-containing protein [Pseudomonadota bacterium]|nr:DUF481 domain-containing protein [Pseudomonadota bacterium]
MREKLRLCVWTMAVGCCLGVSTARAQDPKFTFAASPAEEPPKPVWKASAQAGLILATGNANTLTISGAASASRVDLRNKIALDVNGAYGTATNYVANDTNGDGKLDAGEVESKTLPNTKMWNVKFRYDRFFSKNNLGYLSAQVGGNEPAGKLVYGGAQIGYSRQLLKTERNELLAELGYDFTFEFYPGDPPPTPDRLMIHSLRVFVGHNLTLTKETGLTTGLEGLFNVNPLTAPGFTEEITPFRDTRINFKTALSTTIYKNLSFRFSFTARFDNVPAPRPAPAGFKFADGYQPLAEKLDTLSEAALVVNFL